MPMHPVRQPEWIDAAPIRMSESIDLAAPPSEVWVQIADQASWPESFDALDRVEPLGEPTGVGGGRRVFVRRRAIDESFTAWDVDEHCAFPVVASKLPIAMAESVRLEPCETGTKVTYRQGLDGRRGCGWARKLIGKQPVRQPADPLEARVERSG